MMKKIPAKYEQYIFLLVMTWLIGLSISCLKTVQVFGFGAGFMMQWLSGFLSINFMIVPTVLVIIPVAVE